MVQRFFLHDLARKDGKQPVNLICSHRTDRDIMSTGITLFEANWDKKSQQAVYVDRKKAKILAPDVDYDLMLSAKEVGETNEILNDFRKQICEIEMRHKIDKMTLTTKIVISEVKRLRGAAPKIKMKEKSDIILQYISNWIEDHSSTRAKGSMTVYKSLRAHLAAYAADKKVDITFEGIDHQFMQSFQNFLIEKRNLINVTASKQISTLKTFLGHARKDGNKVSDRYKDFRIKQEKLEVVALSEEEFLGLWNLDLSKDKKLEQVRDVFCFSCVTGLRYSDLKALSWEHIYSDEIRITVQKTKDPLSIPLNAYSYKILSKYKGKYKPLPVISNQKMNDYLKGWNKTDKKGHITKHMGICEMARISTPTEIVRYRGAVREVNVYPKYELVGVHTGRKTFVCISLEKGMTAQQIMKITGHLDYKSFQRYMEITSNSKKEAMVKAWGEVPKAKLKVV